MKKINMIIGIISFIFSVGILISSNSMPGQSAMFPKYLSIIFGILSICLILISLRISDEENNKVDKFFSIPMVKGAILVLVYILLIQLIGFFIATSIFTVIFMILYKEKSKKKILFTTLGINIFIYILFVLQLNVPLPTGLLF